MAKSTGLASSGFKITWTSLTCCGMQGASVAKIINDKRPTFKQLIIRNYEPPKHPPYTAVASPMPLMDLFRVETA
jgi:hypothetical protein